MSDLATDAEAVWLMSRAYLQQMNKTQALAALQQSGTYRTDNPMEPEPGPYVGEARCEACHSKIFRDSLASRHSQTYYRGAQLDQLPLPEKPLADPDDPEVTHNISRRDGALWEDTTVGPEVYTAIINYAFGTSNRSLTMVSRDAHGEYHIGRLSYYDTREGKGWDRSTLDKTHPTRAHPDEFQGEKLPLRDGLVKCLYCHVTNARTGRESIGPEMADRAIGCERCHGPGGNHLLALQLGLPDLAIVNPAVVSPNAVTTTQCNDCHILQKKFGDEDPENAGWVRSQGIGWSRSRCNTESSGAFGCVTCHNPHQSARATSVADYELKCLTCHASTRQPTPNEVPGSTVRTHSGPSVQTCPVSPEKGCLPCHMPKVRIDLLHTDLTDHFIRVHRQER